MSYALGGGSSCKAFAVSTSVIFTLLGGTGFTLRTTWAMICSLPQSSGAPCRKHPHDPNQSFVAVSLIHCSARACEWNGPLACNVPSELPVMAVSITQNCEQGRCWQATWRPVVCFGLRFGACRLVFMVVSWLRSGLSELDRCRFASLSARQSPSPAWQAIGSPRAACHPTSRAYPRESTSSAR